jgi:integrase
MASIQRQHKNWTVRFSYSGTKYRVKVSSKQRAHSIKQRIEDTLTDIRYGRIPIPENACVKTFIVSGGRLCESLCRPVTLVQAVEDFFSTSNRALSTDKMYFNYCRRFIRFAGEECYLKDFDIQSYVESRIRDIQPVTLQKELIALRGLFNQANIVFPYEKIKTRKTLSQFKPLAATNDGRRALLTANEIKALRQLVRANGTELIADVVDFVVYTGVRRSEVVRIVSEDIDWTNNRILIRELKRKHGSETSRYLPIHTELIEVLQKRKHQDFVFTNSVHTLTNAFKSAVKGTIFDKKGLGLHAIRHSIASQLIDKGTPVTVVAEILGHATPMTTLNVYSHAFDTGVKQAISLL